MTSLACSRAMFLFINDPEGPNLLVVVVMATIIYFLSWVAYSLVSCANPLKLLLAIFIQIVITAAFYFCLN